MNIFILSEDAAEAAQLQCDKHAAGKMAVESAQMLSTAHRMLDGYVEKGLSKSGKRTVNHWVHPDAELDAALYKAVHFHHPCTVWTMESAENYKWHYDHFVALCNEFTFRYGKVHMSYTKLCDILSVVPKNIPKVSRTQFKLAMGSNPECMFPNDPVRSYRDFYQTKQERFKMEWSKRPVPEWFKQKEFA
jgi:hypothetical protein